MSALAKVFVVINLVLALFFLGVAAASFENNKSWKKEAENQLAKANELEAAFKQNALDQKQRIAELSSDKSNLGTQYGAAQQEIETLKSSINSKDTEIARISTELSSSKTLLASKEDSLASRTSQVDNAQNRNTELVSETQDALNGQKNAEKIMVRALSDKAAIETQYGDLQKEVVAMKIEMENTRNLLEVIRRNYPEVNLSFNPTPKINGVIQALNPESKIVILSVGQDEAVEEGQKFTVYRDGRYVGIVQVRDVTADMAAAHIQYLEPGMSVQIGDKASTRIGG